MHRDYRYLFGFFFLTAALAAPTAMSAATRPQDNGRQEERHRDNNDQNRVYDRAHKDYHNWNDNGDRSYRVCLGERHLEHHHFVEDREREQRSYWHYRQ